MQLIEGQMCVLYIYCISPSIILQIPFTVNNCNTLCFMGIFCDIRPHIQRLTVFFKIVVYYCICCNGLFGAILSRSFYFPNFLHLDWHDLPYTVSTYRIVKFPSSNVTMGNGPTKNSYIMLTIEKTVIQDSYLTLLLVFVIGIILLISCYWFVRYGRKASISMMKVERAVGESDH